MRPRKQILLYGADEITASILRLVLESRRHYRVEAVPASKRPWLRTVSPQIFLLVGFGVIDAYQLKQRIWKHHPLAAIVSVKARGALPEAIWITDMLESLYLAPGRKRGPKLGTKHAERKVA